MIDRKADATGLILGGRYLVHGEIAHGGMATVHYGRLIGTAGFARTVAIKRMHRHTASDPDFASMFVDEALLVARIRHPNVVPVIDVVGCEGELSLIMEYVQGETLARLLRAANRAGKRLPFRIVSSIMIGVLEGLHAAHEAVSERGERLNIVHRDVSPQNIIVGVDGVARVLDFGIAKATVRLASTQDGHIKGKIPYMAPEQVRSKLVDRRTDIYAASAVLWEVLVGRRLLEPDNEAALIAKILSAPIDPPSKHVPDIPLGLDDVVMRGLERDPTLRFQTAQEMAIALEKAVAAASAREVGRWVETFAAEELKKRAEQVAEIESSRFPVEQLRLQAATSAESQPTQVITRTTGARDAEMNASDRAVLPRPRSRILIGLLAAGVLLLVATLLIQRWVDRPKADAASRATASSATAATDLSSTPAASASGATSTSPAAPEPPAVSNASEPAAHATVGRGSAARPRPAVVSSTTTAPGAPSKTTDSKSAGENTCKPPYYLDSDGIRHVKPECL